MEEISNCKNSLRLFSVASIFARGYESVARFMLFVIARARSDALQHSPVPPGNGERSTPSRRETMAAAKRGGRKGAKKGGRKSSGRKGGAKKGGRKSTAKKGGRKSSRKSGRKGR